MSFWDFIGSLALFKIIRNRLRSSSPRDNTSVGQVYPMINPSYQQHLEESENQINEAEKRIAEYRSIASSALPEGLYDYDIDELQERIDELESRLDECDAMSERYDLIQDEIDILRDRIDDLDDMEGNEEEWEDINDELNILESDINDLDDAYDDIYDNYADDSDDR